MKTKRWEIAQKYEKEYWINIANRITNDAEAQLWWYNWKASEFEKKLNKIIYNFDKNICRILEVGSGPVGIVSFLKWGERYAIDPLGDFYKENRNLIALRDKSVNYVTGGGEAIPFPDSHFSVVIIDNVLDHVNSPSAVLNEINRVLSKDGLLYIELNIHTFWGYLLHSLFSKLRIDKGHPYSFTSAKIRAFLNSHKFIIRSESIDDYYKARERDRLSESLKANIKSYCGLSEFIYSAIYLKKSD